MRTRECCLPTILYELVDLLVLMLGSKVFRLNDKDKYCMFVKLE